MPQVAEQVTAGERELFEQWMRGVLKRIYTKVDDAGVDSMLERDSKGVYGNFVVNERWLGWVACGEAREAREVSAEPQEVWLVLERMDYMGDRVLGVVGSEAVAREYTETRGLTSTMQFDYEKWKLGEIDAF